MVRSGHPDPSPAAELTTGEIHSFIHSLPLALHLFLSFFKTNLCVLAPLLPPSPSSPSFISSTDPSSVFFTSYFFVFSFSFQKKEGHSSVRLFNYRITNQLPDSTKPNYFGYTFTHRHTSLPSTTTTTTFTVSFLPFVSYPSSSSFFLQTGQLGKICCQTNAVQLRSPFDLSLPSPHIRAGPTPLSLSLSFYLPHNQFHSMAHSRVSMCVCMCVLHTYNCKCGAGGSLVRIGRLRWSFWWTGTRQWPHRVRVIALITTTHWLPFWKLDTKRLPLPQSKIKSPLSLSLSSTLSSLWCVRVWRCWPNAWRFECMCMRVFI